MGGEELEAGESTKSLVDVALKNISLMLFCLLAIKRNVENKTKEKIRNSSLKLARECCNLAKVEDFTTANDNIDHEHQQLSSM